MADDEDDTKTAERFAIPRDAITDERLAALRIRVLGTTAIMDIPCILVAKTASKKLSDYGYLTDKFKPTPTEGVTFLALRNPDGLRATAAVDPRTIRLVEFANKPTTKGDQTAVIRRLTTFLRDRIGGIVERSIKFTYGQGNQVALQPGGPHFHVIFHGSPTVGTVRVPSTWWGQKAAGANGGKQQFGFGPYFDGTPLFAPEGEFGAFSNTVLCIYTNAVENGTDADFDILEKMAQQFEKIRKDGFAVDPGVIKTTYIDTCMVRAETELKDLTTRMEQNDKELRDAQDTIINRSREQHDLRMRIAALSSGGDAMKEKLGREFDNLMQHKKIKSVFWRGNRMVVETKTLFFVDPRSKKEHELGEMRIVLETQPFEIRFQNLTRQVRSFHDMMHGPHLFPDGRACLGNMSTILPKMVAEYRFKDAVTQAIAFCEAVNVDDPAGRGCNLWPLSERQKQLDAAGK